MKPWINYIWTSAWAVIFNKEWKIFMAKRWENARDDIWKWEFPGWIILLNENREIAAIRNVEEKYWFEIKIEKLLWVYDVIDKDFWDHWISTTYIWKYENWNPCINFPDKCEKIWWFDLKEIQNMNLSRISKLNLNDILILEKNEEL
jgi:ADP-ribose pyrophosphatase YjhB (NUDIX family)